MATIPAQTPHFMYIGHVERNTTLLMNILTHKVIGLDEHGEDPKCLGVYDTEESAQRVADSWNLIWDNCNCLCTAHVVENH